jgi:GTP-binding protein
MLPVVAIVGRPNVGKSTLFNRLTGGRHALVADEPGVTRDRLAGIVRIVDRSFIAVDTGGLGERDERRDPLSAMVAEQALRAAQEADAVLWLVDARAGLTPVDKTIAARLRPLTPRVYLAVNKAEHLDAASACAEFHALGFGEPLAISALHGEGITSLLDALMQSLPADSGEPLPAPGSATRVAVIGRPNVGKSTLVNRLLGQQRMLTSDQPGTTRDSVAVPFRRDDRDYILIDTAGVRRRSRVTETLEKFSIIKTLRSVTEAHIVILMIDAREGITEQDLRLLGMVIDSGKALVIAVNKWDGIAAERKEELRADLDRQLAFADFASVHTISALHGSGVGELLASVDRAAEALQRDLGTARLTACLQRAVAKYPPPLKHGRPIKLRYAHLGGRNPIRVVIHGNRAGDVPETYRRYLARALREQLQLKGVPLKLDFRQGVNPYRKRGTRQ